MQWLAVAVIASAAIPMAIAWQANRGWTIRHALAWGWLAWLAWFGFAVYPVTEMTFASLSFTSAAGVAVLGARRPGVVAWNFIVASLLIVLWLGWAEGLLAGSGLQLDGLRLLFVVGLIAATLLNYLPTPSLPAVLLLSVGCGMSLMSLWNGTFAWSATKAILVGGSCWVDLLFRRMLRSSPECSTFDQLWLNFRNRYGAVWSERVREQFNAVARHKQWPVYLSWKGLRGDVNALIAADSYAALSALMKRFHSLD